MTGPTDKIGGMDVGKAPGWVLVLALWLLMLAVAVTLALSLGIWKLIEAF